MPNQCFLTVYINLINKSEKQHSNKQIKKDQEKSKSIKIGKIVPFMNHYPQGG